jgi:hypothetical protein
MLLEKKKRLELALDSLEHLIDFYIANAVTDYNKELEQHNASLVEENKLSKDMITSQAQELKALREKNMLALEAVQGIIKNIQNQIG